MADPGDFLARWSRLKRKASAETRREVPPPPAPAVAEQPPAEPPARGEAATAPPAPESELPPIETLGRDSDYTPFMRAGVPEEVRNEALRKLWRSDPVFANLDGLLEYGEDFAAAFSLGGAVATAYRVLEGMPRSTVQERSPPAPDGSAGKADGPGNSAGPSIQQAEAGPAGDLPRRNDTIESDRDRDVD